MFVVKRVKHKFRKTWIQSEGRERWRERERDHKIVHDPSHPYLPALSTLVGQLPPLVDNVGGCSVVEEDRDNGG